MYFINAQIIYRYFRAKKEKKYINILQVHIQKEKRKKYISQ